MHQSISGNVCWALVSNEPHYTKCLFKEVQFAHHTRPALRISGAVVLLCPQSGSLYLRSFPSCCVPKTHVVTCVKTFLLCLWVFDCMRCHVFLLYQGTDGHRIDVLSSIINHTTNATTDPPRQRLAPMLFLTGIVFACLFGLSQGLALQPRLAF